MDSILQFQCLPFNQLEEIRERSSFCFKLEEVRIVQKTFILH